MALRVDDIKNKGTGIGQEELETLTVLETWQSAENHGMKLWRLTVIWSRSSNWTAINHT